MPAYPPIEPFDHGIIQVDDIHKVYYEQCGNPEGLPAVFLHGGPGGGCHLSDRCFFDPAVYRIILFDQRGCGRSTPLFELKNNTTSDLVEDCERVRKKVGVDKWLVFGGSWGSTLALAYAEEHTDRVLALVLRGIFTVSKRDLDHFYQHGTKMAFADHYEDFIAPIPEAERGDLLTAYHKRLIGSNTEEQVVCAKAWSRWEMATCMLNVSEEKLSAAADDDWALAFARIETHFFVNKGFFEEENQLLNRASRLVDIPTTIVHGRYDMICPFATAWELHKIIPHSEIKIIQDAGHSSSEPGIKAALIEATDKYRSLKK